MGIKGIISVADESNFKLDKPLFIEALRKHWTDLQIRENAYGDVTFGMTIKDKFNDFQGEFYNFPDSATRVIWYGGYEDFAAFSIWYREYIPHQYPLEIIDKHSSFVCIVSDSTTEQEVYNALLDDRFDFEIMSPTNTRDVLQIFSEKFHKHWQSLYLYDGDIWRLRSLQGRINNDAGKVIFETNDLSFAAHFIIWCRNALPSDQRLFIRNSKFRTFRYPNPQTQVETELTLSTTEDELFDFLTKSFAKE